MNLFKPEDFEPFYMDKKQLSDHANHILTEWIEKNGKKVYGVIDPAHEEGEDFIMGTRNDPTDTHQAILIDIQEIVKKPCEHEPMWDAVGVVGPYVQTYYKCSKCGVKLRARWEVAE